MDIHCIETGFFSTDGAAMFGIIPPKIWKARYPFDPENRCPLAMRVLFVDFGDRKVLFDAGVGDRVKGADYYRFHDLKSPVAELEKLGYRAEDITDVVLSHLHFDHCAGILCKNNKGEAVLAFPNAVYRVGRGQWEMAMDPPLWEAESFDPNVLNVLKSSGKLHLIESDADLFPGLRIRLVQGHTADQLLSYIDSPSGTWVYVGDVIPMTPHLLPLCVAAVDDSALVSVEEKRKVLREAVENDQILFFFHDAETVAVRLQEKNGRISLKEKVRI